MSEGYYEEKQEAPPEVYQDEGGDRKVKLWRTLTIVFGLLAIITITIAISSNGQQSSVTCPAPVVTVEPTQCFCNYNLTCAIDLENVTIQPFVILNITDVNETHLINNITYIYNTTIITNITVNNTNSS